MLKTFSNLDSLVSIEIDEKEEDLKTTKIKSKKISESGIPFLSYTDKKNAEEMAEPYTILYLFENSLRLYIDKKMRKKYGNGWWNKVVTNKKLRDKVDLRKKKEGINKWHVPRGASEIFYTDLLDLTYILNKERKTFEAEIEIDLWTTTINTAVSLSRNIIDHHNPLTKREIGRLKMILEDWIRQFK
jgi:hypothetical protein